MGSRRLLIVCCLWDFIFLSKVFTFTEWQYPKAPSGFISVCLCFNVHPNSNAKADRMRLVVVENMNTRACVPKKRRRIKDRRVLDGEMKTVRRRKSRSKEREKKTLGFLMDDDDDDGTVVHSRLSNECLM